VPLWAGWSATALLVLGAWLVALAFPGFGGMGRMWLLAGALWLGFKIIAWTRQTKPVSPLFALWVGMDAIAFTSLCRDAAAPPPRVLPGFLGLAVGVLLLGGAVLSRELALLPGVLMMAGFVGALHFGLFHLLAVGLRRFGYPVAPIMREPWRAATLAELWGSRWNRAFSDVARIAIFRPLVRRFGAVRGTLAGFLASGLAHELVVSVPAGGGYGLPTLYFLIQGLAVGLQRRHPGLGRGFTWLVFLAPAPLLFHPPFLEILNPQLLLRP
jgi:hypothetical protein